jgi:hypothetical protein
MFHITILFLNKKTAKITQINEVFDIISTYIIHKMVLYHPIFVTFYRLHQDVVLH